MPVLSRNTVFRDYETEGIPSSGEYDPDKAEMRQYFGQLEALSASGAVMVDTKSALDAITDRDDNAPGYVVADSTDADNGIYAWDDAGAQWVRLRGFPDSVAVATNVAGTADAITADTKTGVDPAEVGLLILVPTTTTTNATVTLALNGGAAENIVDVDGSALDVGDLGANVPAILIRGSSEWQLALPVNSINRAETAQTAAELAQSAAETAQSTAETAAMTALGATWTPDGGWVTATSYQISPRDVVSHNGSSYVCIADHTSGATTEPGIGASWQTNWELLAERGDDGSDGAAGLWLGGEGTITGVASGDLVALRDVSDTDNPVFATVANVLGALVSSFRSLVGVVAGDLFYASGDNAVARLAKGTARQVATMNAGATAPEWATPIISQEYESPAQTITSGGAIGPLAHGLGVIPKFVFVRIECTTAENGYSVGDPLDLHMLNSSANAGAAWNVAIVKDATNLNVRWGQDGIRAPDFSTGAAVTLTDANWEAYFIAWA